MDPQVSCLVTETLYGLYKDNDDEKAGRAMKRNFQFWVLTGRNNSSSKTHGTTSVFKALVFSDEIQQLGLQSRSLHRDEPDISPPAKHSHRKTARSKPPRALETTQRSEARYQLVGW